jgi:hypothetical protein
VKDGDCKGARNVTGDTILNLIGTFMPSHEREKYLFFRLNF